MEGEASGVSLRAPSRTAWAHQNKNKTHLRSRRTRTDRRSFFPDQPNLARMCALYRPARAHASRTYHEGQRGTIAPTEDRRPREAHHLECEKEKIKSARLVKVNQRSLID